MSTHYHHLLLEKKRLAVLYRFDKRGDGIPEHAHNEDMTHDVTCTRGSIIVYGPTLVWCHALKAGEKLVFDSTQPHEIQALEDDSSCVNEYYHGIPANYATLGPEVKQGTVQLPLKLQLSTGLI